MSQEEEAIRRAHRLTKQGPDAATDQDDRRTQTTSSNPESGDMEQDIYDHNLGIFIGRYDPFKRAYLQPALRANPRARPEQPFPPNQLGRIEVLQQPTEDEQLLHSSGATVRLKGMNQQNRRLVNRWWNDQLQRCGDQSIVNVLIGEECGSLTIGRRANLMELSGRHEMI